MFIAGTIVCKQDATQQCECMLTCRTLVTACIARTFTAPRTSMFGSVCRVSQKPTGSDQ